jgi:phage tail-like protein
MAVYYPPVGFHFQVYIPVGDSKKSTKNDIANNQNDKDTRFQEVSGLTAEVGTEELQVGGENRFTYRLPTRAKYGNLILKRGMVRDSGLISWITDAIEHFIFKPTDVTVTLLDGDHNPLATWNFKQAYPVKWVTSDFKAQDNSLVIETLELVYQNFTREITS